jgi:hypothetical protein
MTKIKYPFNTTRLLLTHFILFKPTALKAQGTMDTYGTMDPNLFLYLVVSPYWT